MLRIQGIKITITEDNYLINSSKEIAILKNRVANQLFVNVHDIITIEIAKKSIDARKKPTLYYIYSVDVTVKNENKVLKNKSVKNVIKLHLKADSFPIHNICYNKKRSKIVIIGMGPAGLFAAYMLAINGYRPLIIERGACVEDRKADVDNYWASGRLKLNSNATFGEGGAGTFSDGKLHTLVKDNNAILTVLDILIANGADPSIKYLSKPHVGTDKLIDIVANMRNKIIEHGGEVMFNTTMHNILLEDGIIKSVIIDDGINIPTDQLILAIGHSARDTFRMLYSNGLDMISKPFAVGLRIEHPRELIDSMQYGGMWYNKLPASDYKLTHRSKSGRGIYSFCMCPGGYVVDSSTEDNKLCINGMSYSDRKSSNSNSAIVVTVNNIDYGSNNALSGILYQEEIERRAYDLGSGRIPQSRLSDYMRETNPSYLDKLSIGNIDANFKTCVRGRNTWSLLGTIFNEDINNCICESIIDFNRLIPGFSDINAIVSGVESRTSSPIRITRDDNMQSNYNGIYPCGEGAGYAGGITSAAIDGIKVASKIAERLGL